MESEAADHDIIGDARNVCPAERHDDAERALAIASSILSSSLVGVAVVDRDLRYIQINEALARMNGKPVADHLGHTIYEVLGEDAEHVVPLVERVLRTGEPVSNVELARPVRAATYRQRSFLASYSPVRLSSGEIVGVSATIVDITEHKRAERALAFLAEATTALASSLDTGDTVRRTAELMVPDVADWCVVDLVPEGGAPRRIAVAHKDAKMRPVLEELAERYPLDWDAPTGVTAMMRSGTPLLATITDAHLVEYARDATHLELMRTLGVRSTIVAPLVARGRTLGAITVVANDPERSYGRSELDLVQELAARAGVAIDNARLFDEAQHAVRLRENLLAVVSHDLRNPLGAVELASTLALSVIQEPQARKHVATIHRAAARMTLLIGDLLDTAGIQAGRLVLELAPESPMQLVSDAIDLHEPSARAKGIALVREGEVGDVLVLCDRRRIAQVFGNLLGNALKFCRRGDTITVRLRVEPTQVRIAVADTGPGMEPDVAAKVFEPYWSAREHAGKGTGLGLWIARSIVEAHGGQISVTSAPGQGATFELTLPPAGDRRAPANQRSVRPGDTE